MARIGALITAVFLFFVSASSVAQDSTNTISGWKVESRKTGEGLYELRFTLPSFNKWQLYAPNQSLSDIKTTELQFADSSVQQQGEFLLDGMPVEMKSEIFEGTIVRVYEGQAGWKAVVKKDRAGAA